MDQRFSAGGINNGPGVTGTIADSLPFFSKGNSPEPPPAGGSPQSAGGSMPHITLIGFFGLLALIWLVQRVNAHLRENSLPANIVNFFVVGLMASASILTAKVVLNKWPIPNVTPAINAV